MGIRKKDVEVCEACGQAVLKIEDTHEPPSKDPWSTPGYIPGILRKLKRGQSVLFKTTDLTRINRLRQNIYQQAKRVGVDVALRRRPEGVRLWKI